MKKFINGLQSLLLVPAVVLGISVAAPVVAAAATNCTNTDTGDVSKGLSGGANSACGAGQTNDLFGSTGIFSTITNVLLYVIGAIAVIMLIIGGIRYITSGGDSGQVTSAKNTILYAVIGIVVSILAYAIVHFVIGSFGGGGTTGA